MSETMRFREFAERIGCKPSYVTKLRQAGRLVLTPDGRHVLVAESIARLRATASPDKAGVAQRHAHTRGGALATATPPPTAPEPPMPATAPDLPLDDPAPGSLDDARSGSLYQTARGLREKYLAAQAKLDLEERIGQLVAANDVRQASADLGATVRQRLESLPDILAGQVNDSDRERIYSLAADHIELILTDLSRHLAQLGKPKEPA